MIKTGLFIFIACAAASCTAPETKTTTESVESVGKPGAALSFSHALQAPVTPGGSGVLELTIDEAYNEGALEMSAAASGLDLASASQALSLSLDGASSHRWDVFFTAPNAGVYYIDFAATVTDGNGVSSSRSYSAAVQIGDGAALAKPDANVVLDADGNPVMIMEAEETVEE